MSIALIDDRSMSRESDAAAINSSTVLCSKKMSTVRYYSKLVQLLIRVIVLNVIK